MYQKPNESFEDESLPNSMFNRLAATNRIGSTEAEWLLNVSDDPPRHEIPPASAAKPGSSVNDSQVGGSHYKVMYPQPWDVIIAWEQQGHIGYLEGCAIKYLARWRHKKGTEDLEKAKHFIDKLIEVTNNAATMQT